MSIPIQAIRVKNQVADHEDHLFVDGSGEEVPLKMCLKKLSFPDDDKMTTSDIQSHPLDQVIKFGETLEINFADYFPDRKPGDKIFLVAFFGVETNKVFLMKEVTIQDVILNEDDIVVICTDVCFSYQGDTRVKPLQDLYKFIYYTVSKEQDKP
jgi:hypothetical protein